MIIKDKDLGDIKLIENTRSKRITVRYKDGCFQLSYPPFVSQAIIKKSIEEMKPNLIKLRDNAKPKQLINEELSIKTLSFRTEVAQNSLTRYYSRLSEGILYITYPHSVLSDDQETQANIRVLIEKAMRYEANRIFPKKVSSFASKYGFNFTDISINKSRTRWGSCSSKKKINLSYYCMLLPEYLVDFIILHELCHTVEMNHGKRFGELLDRISEGKSKEYTRELKNHKTSW